MNKSELIQNEQKKEIEKYKTEIEISKLNLNNNEQKQEELLKNRIKTIQENLITKYNNEIISKIKDIKKDLYNKLKDKTNKLEKKYTEEFKKKENMMEKKYNEISEIIMKSQIGKKEENLNFSTLKIEHKGIKCSQCFKEPIIGFRYKCSICDNYNLCEVCENNNAASGDHPHDFIKIRKEEKNNNTTIINNNKIQINEQNNDKENIINKINIVNNINQNKDENIFQINEDNKKTNGYINNKNNGETDKETNNEKFDQNIEETIIILNEDKKIDYSYECLNILNLSSYIYEQVNETTVDIILKNNGNKEWPKNTKLSFQQKSEIKGNDLLLDSQSPGQQKHYSIYFNNIGDYSPKEYKIFYLFNINGENLGEEIIVRINIKEKEQANNELNEYRDQIKEFRDNYGLENDVEDEKILRLLKETNFNYEATFDKLFD